MGTLTQTVHVNNEIESHVILALIYYIIFDTYNIVGGKLGLLKDATFH